MNSIKIVRIKLRREKRRGRRRRGSGYLEILLKWVFIYREKRGRFGRHSWIVDGLKSVNRNCERRW